MEDLKKYLTEEELELAQKMAKEFAEKVLLDFSNQKEALANEIQKLTEEDNILKAEYSSISEWKEREVIMNKRREKEVLISVKNNQLKNIDNQLKALSNGGTVVKFEDKTGKMYDNVADFTNVKTDVIAFDQETILVDEIPAYIPFIDEEKFERRGAVLDAIRYTTDTYVVAYADYVYNSTENQVFLLTLDQLVLTNLYYLTKLKAVYKKKADQKTEKSKEYYFSLPLERRERHYAQRGFYQSLNKTLQKKYSEQEWDNLPLDKKEELAPAYKIYGSEKIKSKLESNEMYSSFHDMYNVFINPEALRLSSNKVTRLKIGEMAFGSYANPIVFSYWKQFREMMEYKFKDIEFQRAETSENYKTAIETSFGESNTENYLFADYGVLVKRQNGDKINALEVEQIQEGLNVISKVFGNLKEEFIKNNIKISHTGKKLVFAQKAVGVYIPSMGTIAVSDKYGEIQFNSTFAHELAHFIDNKLGQKNGKRWESDNFESTAGVIAFTFRNNLNKPKEQQTDYINATKECFARAMQQYFVMQQYGDDVEIVYGYGAFNVPEKISNQEVFVKAEIFNEKIKPLIEQFLQENKDFFSAELQMKKVVEEIKETTTEIVPVIETKPTETNELQEAIETLEMLLETLEGEDKKEVQEALEILQMLNGEEEDSEKDNELENPFFGLDNDEIDYDLFKKYKLKLEKIDGNKVDILYSYDNGLSKKDTNLIGTFVYQYNDTDFPYFRSKNAMLFEGKKTTKYKPLDIQEIRNIKIIKKESKDRSYPSNYIEIFKQKFDLIMDKINNLDYKSDYDSYVELEKNVLSISVKIMNGNNEKDKKIVTDSLNLYSQERNKYPIRKALKDGYYQDRIKSKQMSAEKVVEILKSKNLEVPKEILQMLNEN